MNESAVRIMTQRGDSKHLHCFGIYLEGSYFGRQKRWENNIRILKILCLRMEDRRNWFSIVPGSSFRC